MATYEKKKLSGSSQGQLISLTNAFPMTIHTTGSSSTILDEVWLWAKNTDAAEQTVVINFSVYAGEVEGGIIRLLLPPNSITSILQGQIVSGDGSSGLIISGESPVWTGYISVYGFVNRITP